MNYRHWCKFKYLASQAIFPQQLILRTEYLPARDVGVGERRAVPAFLIRTAFQFPTGPLGRNDWDCLGFFLPMLIQTAQEKEYQDSHCHRDTDPKKQTKNEGQHNIHQAPYVLWIFS
jgi:hypothetical protein